MGKSDLSKTSGPKDLDETQQTCSGRGQEDCAPGNVRTSDTEQMETSQPKQKVRIWGCDPSQESPRTVVKISQGLNLALCTWEKKI